MSVDRTVEEATGRKQRVFVVGRFVSARYLAAPPARPANDTRNPATTRKFGGSTFKIRIKAVLIRFKGSFIILNFRRP